MNILSKLRSVCSALMARLHPSEMPEERLEQRMALRRIREDIYTRAKLGSS